MAEGMVNRYNIETYLDQSEPVNGILMEERIPLSEWTEVDGSHASASATGTKFNGLDSATVAGDAGWSSAITMPVLSFKESAEAEVFRLPTHLPHDLALQSADGRFEPYIAIGLRWRFVSAALASTSKSLKVVTRWHNQGVNNTFNSVTVTGSAAGTGVAYATTSAFQWTWFEVCGAVDTTVGMTAAQKRALVAGALIDYQIGVSAALASDECFQISATAIRMRRHITVKDKTARAYRPN